MNGDSAVLGCRSLGQLPYYMLCITISVSYGMALFVICPLLIWCRISTNTCLGPSSAKSALQGHPRVKVTGPHGAHSFSVSAMTPVVLQPMLGNELLASRPAVMHQGCTMFREGIAQGLVTQQGLAPELRRCSALTQELCMRPACPAHLKAPTKSYVSHQIHEPKPGHIMELVRSQMQLIQPA